MSSVKEMEAKIRLTIKIYVPKNVSDEMEWIKKRVESALSFEDNINYAFVKEIYLKEV